MPVMGASAADEWARLGGEAHAANKPADAERCYRRAVAVQANHAGATHNLGILLAQSGQLNEGLLAIERSVMFDGSQPLMHANRALAYLDADRVEEGLSAAKIGVELAVTAAGNELVKAGYLHTRLAWCMLAATSGHPEHALPVYREMLATEPAHPAAGANACFVQTLVDVGPDELLRQRKVWLGTHGYKGPVWGHGNAQDPDKVLRVGYVGGDLKSHSAAMMFSHVLLNHDRTKVTPYFYSSLPTNPEADDMTRQFQTAAGRLRENPDDGPPLVVADGHTWRDIYGMTDEQADDTIRKDGIDILVDLAGHTNGGRLGLFTRKPAPVQVTAWGFAHGSGVPQVDYFFADPVAVPEAERPHFAERIYDLPCIVTYRPPVEYGLKGTSPLPFYSNEFITFGSFSRYEKLSDDCLETFHQILRRVPNSKLYLKDHAFRRPYSIRRVRSAMPDINPDRLLFGISTSHVEHLGVYQSCDIYLDTFPHGAGVVTLECLYMGVPLLTRYGPQPAGRTAASVLTAIGRTDWIAKDAAEFVAKAVEWAGRPADLAAARKTLRDELVASPVIAGYREAVETAYRDLWREWCAKAV